MINILIVEDDDADVDLMKEALPKGIVYFFERAVDGEQGLNLVEEFNPDIILLDLNIPKINGIAFLKECKRHPKHKTIPVIVVSTSDSSEEIAKAYKAGANAYLVKTFDFSSFETKMKHTGDFWFHAASLPKLN